MQSAGDTLEIYLSTVQSLLDSRVLDQNEEEKTDQQMEEGIELMDKLINRLKNLLVYLNENKQETENQDYIKKDKEREIMQSMEQEIQHMGQQNQELKKLITEEEKSFLNTTQALAQQQIHNYSQGKQLQEDIQVFYEEEMLRLKKEEVHEQGIVVREKKYLLDKEEYKLREHEEEINKQLKEQVKERGIIEGQLRISENKILKLKQEQEQQMILNTKNKEEIDETQGIIRNYLSKNLSLIGKRDILQSQIEEYLHQQHLQQQHSSFQWKNTLYSKKNIKSLSRPNNKAQQFQFQKKSPAFMNKNTKQKKIHSLEGLCMNINNNNKQEYLGDDDDDDNDNMSEGFFHNPFQDQSNLTLSLKEDIGDNFNDGSEFSPTSSTREFLKREPSDHCLQMNKFTSPQIIHINGSFPSVSSFNNSASIKKNIRESIFKDEQLSPLPQHYEEEENEDDEKESKFADMRRKNRKQMAKSEYQYRLLNDEAFSIQNEIQNQNNNEFQVEDENQSCKMQQFKQSFFKGNRHSRNFGSLTTNASSTNYSKNIAALTSSQEKVDETSNIISNLNKDHKKMSQNQAQQICNNIMNYLPIRSININKNNQSYQSNLNLGTNQNNTCFNQ